MKNILTVAEFFRDAMEGGQSVYNKNQRIFLEKAVEFAKEHRKLQKEEILKQLYDKARELNSHFPAVYADLIQNAYPETNIK